MDQNKKVLVAMSGGVDSSVCAALLKDQGYAVRGVYLIPWHASALGFSRVGDPEDALKSAQQAADQLNIPLDVLDLQEPFYERVIGYFVQGYLDGKTPNPCFMCNRIFKWPEFLRHADRMGFDYVASGHYAILKQQEDGLMHLFQGADPKKDQSYVLSCLDQSVLRRILLPLGNHHKEQVRQLAAQYGFDSAKRSDSQDMCFIQNDEHKALVKAMLGEKRDRIGVIETLDGQVVGVHQGLENYTYGQRKGIRVAASEPYYVLSKDLTQNKLIVGPKKTTQPSSLLANQLNWISGKAPADQFSAQVKIRYQAKATQAHIQLLPERKLRIDFHEAVHGITPGQFAVIYTENEILGAGEIEREIISS